jgi:LacI family transcriptional regulator
MTQTLKEIAERLNISTATVSRVLNGKPGVSAEIRQKVLDLANEFRFTPNPAAKSLSTSKTYAIAFVIKRKLVYSDNPFYDRIMVGAEQELEKHGYHLISITVNDEQTGDSWMPPGLDPRRLDGLIITGCELSDKVMMTLLSLGLPTVLSANTLSVMSVDAVSSDNRKGSYAATKHLILEHSHEKIAYLMGPKNWSPVSERLLGYEEAMKEQGLQPLITCCNDLEIKSGASSLEETLRNHPGISAVLASNDPMAIGALQAARKLGIKVPEDLAVIGFDDIPWSETTEPSLTTVAIQKEQIGKLTARRLLELIEEGPQPSIVIRVSNELILRRSCGCNPPTDQAKELGIIPIDQNS